MEHKIQGLKNMQESIIPKIYHLEKLDEKITVEDDPAYEITRLLATKEGIFVGMFACHKRRYFCRHVQWCSNCRSLTYSQKNAFWNNRSNFT